MELQIDDQVCVLYIVELLLKWLNVNGRRCVAISSVNICTKSQSLHSIKSFSPAEHINTFNFLYLNILNNSRQESVFVHKARHQKHMISLLTHASTFISGFFFLGFTFYIQL
eukprot:110481_1